MTLRGFSNILSVLAASTLVVTAPFVLSAIGSRDVRSYTGMRIYYESETHSTPIPIPAPTPAPSNRTQTKPGLGTTLAVSENRNAQRYKDIADFYQSEDFYEISLSESTPNCEYNLGARFPSRCMAREDNAVFDGRKDSILVFLQYQFPIQPLRSVLNAIQLYFYDLFHPSMPLLGAAAELTEAQRRKLYGHPGQLYESPARLFMSGCMYTPGYPRPSHCFDDGGRLVYEEERDGLLGLYCLRARRLVEGIIWILFAVLGLN